MLKLWMVICARSPLRFDRMARQRDYRFQPQFEPANLFLI
jgi:hypothetical protein